MEEAKYSFNIKFNLDGFDCQITVRTDTTGNEVIDLGTKAIQVLQIKGAKPDRRWEAIKNNNVAPKERKPETEPEDLWTTPTETPESKERLCPVCGHDGELELISTRYGRRFKCQNCGKWLPNALQPTEEELARME